MKRYFFLFSICISLFFVSNSCGDKEDNLSRQGILPLTRNDSTQLFHTNKPLDIPSDTSIGNELDFKVLESIFPKKIKHFTLQNINYGNLQWKGKSIKIISGEYISNFGPAIISCFDYLGFSLLPDHLKNFFDPLSAKNNPDKFYIGKDIVGTFRTDNFTNAKSCEFIYKKRFYIKVEGYNSPLQNDDFFDMVNSLYLSKLKDIQGNK